MTSPNRYAAFARVEMLHADGRLGRRLGTDHIERPDLLWPDFKRKRLVYDTRNQLADARSEVGLLDAFIRLDKATDGQIAEFAQKYGVLSVRAFNRPGVYAESFSTWRATSLQMSATLTIAEHVRRRVPASPELWRQVPGWVDMTPLFSWQGQWSAAKIRLLAERLQLRDAVDHWLKLAKVRPCFMDSSAALGLGFTNLDNNSAGSGLSLLGALALQLALAASGARSLTTCSECRLPYVRQGRRPAVGRDNYCPRCQKSGAPMRAARARYRESQRTGSRRGQ